MEIPIVPDTYSQLPADLLSSGNRLDSQIRAAQNSSGEKRKSELKAAAQEFESLFVAYLLKAMRETIDESGLTDGGFGKTIYTELFDQEVSRCIARRGALGIADLIYEKITANSTAKEEQQKSKPIPGDVTVSPSQAPSSASPQDGGASPGAEPEITDLQLPVQAPICSAFGLRRDPMSHLVQFHKGVDLSAPEGTKVASALPGTVVFAGYENGYGNTILIQHSGGLQTRYGHLRSIAVKTGDVVSSEAILGTVGSTGRSTGPHLHFEVIRMGKPVDPLPELSSQLVGLERGTGKPKDIG